MPAMWRDWRVEAMSQKREHDGRYAFDGNYDRVCVCGHTLGVHGAGSPADCLLYSFNDAEKATELASGKHTNLEIDCGCQKFRLTHLKTKFERGGLRLWNGTR